MRFEVHWGYNDRVRVPFPKPLHDSSYLYCLQGKVPLLFRERLAVAGLLLRRRNDRCAERFLRELGRRRGTRRVEPALLQLVKVVAQVLNHLVFFFGMF